ncbi:MAG: hypothetical protein AAF822_12140 [Pseudomonadota bacterium]
MRISPEVSEEGIAMIRLVLPATLTFFLSVGAKAEELRVPGLSDTAPTLDLPACENTRDQNNCARVLACVGRDGLWLDGQARGWNSGSVAVQRSDGVVCAGTWAADDGPLGSGTARFECSDGSQGRVIYFSQDSLTGTAIARGMDDMGRHIRAWTGENVLQYLGDGDVEAAKLPCTDAAIPIS